jgi:Spy/CpxP family protein refolding chaperone
MRQLKIAVLLFVLASFLTLMAAAQTSGSSPSTSSPSTATSPSSAGSSAGQSSATSPSAGQTSPGATSSQGSSTGAPSPGSSAGTSSASGSTAHSQTVEDALGLTADQKAKLQPIIDDEVKQINAVRDDNSLTMEQKQTKVDQIRQSGFPKIQAILTPEQRQKLADMQAQRTHQQGAPQSAPPTTSQPPQ